MESFRSFPPRAVVIGRLRAAGCVFAEDEADLLMSEVTDIQMLERMIAQRVDGQPLEQIVGWAEFCGLRIRITPHVFVPRRRTELLVHEAAARAAIAKPPGESAVVVDLCCGSGAIATALAALLPEADVWASDIEPHAVDCARLNVEPVGGTVCSGDLFEALPSSLRGSIDILAVNAPYVPSDKIRLMPPEARLYEPMVTLDGGADGLELHRRIAMDARHWLAPGGSLFIETSERQAPLTREICERHGLHTTIARSDDLDATVVIGTRD
jgi:release factor glutamine methyltransferase